MLSETTKIPKYYQISQQIIDMIHTGRLKPRTRIKDKSTFVRQRNIVAGKNTPIPFNFHLERASVPQEEDIVEAVKKYYIFKKYQGGKKLCHLRI